MRGSADLPVSLTRRRTSGTRAAESAKKDFKPSVEDRNPVEARRASILSSCPFVPSPYDRSSVPRSKNVSSRRRAGVFPSSGSVASRCLSDDGAGGVEVRHAEINRAATTTNARGISLHRGCRMDRERNTDSKSPDSLYPISLGMGQCVIDPDLRARPRASPESRRQHRVGRRADRSLRVLSEAAVARDALLAFPVGACRRIGMRSAKLRPAWAITS